MRERQVFNPEILKRALATNMVDALRAMADAIEIGDIDCHLRGVEGNGFYKSTSWPDPRIHISVFLDVTAEVFRYADGATILLEPPTLELPIARKELP